MTAATLLAATLHAAAPAAKPPAPYPLEGYLTGIAEQHWRERAAQLARIRTPAEVQARAQFIRREFLKAIGGLPDQRGPLNARITGTVERKGYRIDKLIFESLPGAFVTANLYVPTTGPGPYPAILGTAGHSMVEGKAAPLYQKGFAALARRGNIVLAYDPPAQGERYEHRDPATGAMRSVGHISPGLQCLLTGGTVARYFLWDGIRAVDYLLTRPDVDPRRLGAAGNSGGGTQSAFLAVVEPRLAAVAPSCYWTSWELLWKALGPQDSEQVLPNYIRNGLDFSDLAIAFAPKAVLMLTATRDSFPIVGARAQYAEAKPLFALLGAESQLGFFEYDDGHGWSQPRREATAGWFDRWFHQRTGPTPEPADLEPETMATLQCTETGQVVTALGSKTTQVLNQEVAERLLPRRSLAQPKPAAEARRIIAARLAIPEARTAAAATVTGRKAGAEFRTETVTLVPEPGIELRVEVILPAGAGGRRPAVIVVRDGVAPVDPAADPEVAAWRQAGRVVVVAQLRGLTPLLPKAKTYYTLEYRTAMRAILLGKTMAGMRVQDLLAVFDYAASRPEVRSDQIAIIGRGNMGVVALYAGALEPKISRVVAAEAILSYMEIVRASDYSERLADIIVPGVLLDFDLPDLAALAGEGRLVLVNPAGADGLAAPAPAVKAAYGLRTRVVATTSAITPALVD